MKQSKLSEQEILAIINNIANRLARKFRFGYHDIEDMKQEARLIAWEGMAAWDKVRPLENFLWTHVRNRLYNLKRDKYERPRPCIKCKNNNSAKCEGANCEYYSNWETINQTKKNLMIPIDIYSVDDEHEKHMKVSCDIDVKIDYDALVALIDRELPVLLRPLFIKLKYGNKLNKVEKSKIQAAIQEIIKKHGYS